MSFCLYNKKNVTRRLVAKTMFYSLAALVRKVLFCHSKIKFISSCHRVIFSIYKSYCVAPKGIVFAPFRSENGYKFFSYGSGIGYGFQGTGYGTVLVISIPNE